MKKDSIGSMFGIPDPRVNQHKLQKFLGPFEDVDQEVLLGVEVEWEVPSGDIGDTISILRDFQPGLTYELVSQWYPSNRIKPSLDHLEQLRGAISNRLIQYHEEASLVGGLEMVVGPANSRLTRLLVESLLASGTGRVNASDRCSTHVHMNVSDLTMGQLGVMTLLYPFIEELLFKWVEPQRWHNPFTRPWCTDAVTSTEPRKYQALNIVPSGCRLDAPFGELVLSDVGRRILGTVEFRHFPGLTPRNVNMFFHWLDFIEEFRSVCLSTTREALIATFQPLASTSGYVEVLRNLFPLTSGHWLLRFTYNDIQAFMAGAVAAFRRQLGTDRASKEYRATFGLREILKSPFAQRLNAAPRPANKKKFFVSPEDFAVGSSTVERSLTEQELRVSIDDITERLRNQPQTTSIPMSPELFASPGDPRVANPRPATVRPATARPATGTRPTTRRR